MSTEYVPIDFPVIKETHEQPAVYLLHSGVPTFPPLLFNFVFDLSRLFSFKRVKPNYIKILIA